MTGLEAVTPPHDLGAERAVLGAMLQHRPLIADLERVLSAASFYRPTHGMVFEAILDLERAGEPADAVTIIGALIKRGWLERVGGGDYVHTLVASVPEVSNGGHYARIVAGMARLRGVVDVGMSLVQLGLNPGADPQEVCDRAQALVHAATTGRSARDPHRVDDFFADVLEDAGNPTQAGKTKGVPTGFLDLDELTNGLYPGQLWVIAARPGIGKSTIGLDMCRSASIRHDITSAMFSMEMTGKEVAARLLSAEAKVNLSALRSGRLEPDDLLRLTRRMGEIAEAPLFVDDSARMTRADIRAKARRLRQTDNLGLLVVDYLQLMASLGRVESREQEVGENARGLKELGGELGIPVVAIAQLNRSSEQRADKRPVMSDIRESGAIEAHADGIILLYREEEVEKDSARSGEADLIVVKNRNGPKGTVTVAFQGHYSRFVDMAN